MATTTARLALLKPEALIDDNVWGPMLNSNADVVDEAVGANTAAITAHTSRTDNPHGTTAAQTIFTPAGTSAVVRSAQVKLREVAVSVADFGAVGDGVTDDSPAFQAAVNSVPSGSQVRIVVPGSNGNSGNLVYNLVTAIANNGRIPYYEMQAGASTVQFTASRFSWPARWSRRGPSGTRHEYSSQAISASESNTSHEFVEMNRAGNTTKGAGIRWNFTSPGYGTGFDIAHMIVGIWDRSVGQDAGQSLTQWLVNVSPQNGGATTRWGHFCAEWNIVNRYADTGWTKKRGNLNNWSGVFQVVPEAQLFGQAGAAYDVTYGIVMTGSSVAKADGLPARMHTGILMEPGAITPTGYGAYWSGNDSGVAGRDPVAGLALDDRWQTGIDLSAGTYSSNAIKSTGFTVSPAGAVSMRPAASATPAANGDLVFEATSNTSVKVKLKGSDGVVRSATLTLA